MMSHAGSWRAACDITIRIPLFQTESDKLAATIGSHGADQPTTKQRLVEVHDTSLLRVFRTQ
jgi:hypothetical protein